jgi:hypothetical protein
MTYMWRAVHVRIRKGSKKLLAIKVSLKYFGIRPLLLPLLLNKLELHLFTPKRNLLMQKMTTMHH